MKKLFKVKAIGKMAGIVVLLAAIGFSMAACADDSGASTPLNGYWTIGASDIVVHISGNSGVYTQMKNYSDLWRSAMNKGYIGIGSQDIRNLTRTSDSTYTCRMLVINYNTSSPSVALSTEYRYCNITMSTNGQSFNYFIPADGTYSSLSGTYYRWQ
jgi:hypothetical protein